LSNISNPIIRGSPFRHKKVGLLAEPFEPLAGERAADVGVQWTELESSLDRRSNCYGHAAADWMGIEAELDDIQQWCLLKLEWAQHSVTPGEEDETLAQIQVCNFPFFFVCLLSKKNMVVHDIRGQIHDLFVLPPCAADCVQSLSVVTTISN
jgi:hypothetical protein